MPITWHAFCLDAIITRAQFHGKAKSCSRHGKSEMLDLLSDPKVRFIMFMVNAKKKIDCESQTLLITITFIVHTIYIRF